MNHPENIEILNDYIDDELSTDMLLELEAHISGCDHCSEYVYSLRLLRSRINELPADITPPAGLWEQVSAGIHKLKTKEENYTPEPGTKVKSFGESKKTDRSTPPLLSKIKSFFKKL